MQKALCGMIFAVLVLGGSCLAQAEEEQRDPNGSGEVTVRVPVKALDPGLRDCIRVCLEKQTDCARAREGARQAWRRLLDRLDLYEGRITTLEERVGGLADRDSQLGTKLQQLSSQVQELSRQVSELQPVMSRLGQLEGRVDSLEEGQIRQDSEMLARFATLEARISRAERRNGTVQIGFVGGGVYLITPSGASYSGGLIGARLQLHITRRMAVYADLQAALAYSEQPAGLRGAGGVQMHLAAGRIVVSTEISALWVGYDRHLDASSLFLCWGMGVEYRPHRVIGIGVNYMAGAVIDYTGRIEFATGPVGTISLYLPWW